MNCMFLFSVFFMIRLPTPLIGSHLSSMLPPLCLRHVCLLHGSVSAVRCISLPPLSDLSSQSLCISLVLSSESLFLASLGLSMFFSICLCLYIPETVSLYSVSSFLCMHLSLSLSLSPSVCLVSFSDSSSLFLWVPVNPPSFLLSLTLCLSIPLSVSLALSLSLSAHCHFLSVAFCHLETAFSYTLITLYILFAQKRV